MEIVHAVITAKTRPAPGFIRLTLSHPRFCWQGNPLDSYVKLFVGKLWPEQPWQPELLTKLRLSDETALRSYTISSQQPGQITLDCAEHDLPAGCLAPGLEFFRSCQVGDVAGLLIPSPGEETWTPAARLVWPEQLVIVADETALPAAHNLMQQQPEARLIRLHGGKPEQVELAVTLLQAQLAELLGGVAGPLAPDLPADDLVWDEAPIGEKIGVCLLGEAGQIRRLRRIALAYPKLTKRDVSAMAYWRRGLAGG